jgi:hypothetical protein
MYCRGRGVLFWASLIIAIYIQCFSFTLQRKFFALRTPSQC